MICHYSNGRQLDARSNIIPFPFNSRVGRVRDVAFKLLNKPTSKSFDYYQRQVSELITKELQNIGQSETRISQELELFWIKVWSNYELLKSKKETI